MWACHERFLTCVGGHTRTCTHNLGFPDGFDDEEEEEEKEREVSWRAWHLPLKGARWQGRLHSPIWTLPCI